MCAEQIALTNQFANRESEAQCLWDDLCGHALMVGELHLVRLRGEFSVALQRSVYQVVKHVEQLTTEVWLVVRREHDWNAIFSQRRVPRVA